MNKSILAIDTPKSCEECKLCAGFMGKHYCPPRDTVVSKGERDCSCPLVAVPDKMDPTKARGAYDTAYTEGWNAFRNKILGGTNE